MITVYKPFKSYSIYTGKIKLAKNHSFLFLYFNGSTELQLFCLRLYELSHTFLVCILKKISVNKASFSHTHDFTFMNVQYFRRINECIERVVLLLLLFLVSRLLTRPLFSPYNCQIWNDMKMCIWSLHVGMVSPAAVLEHLSSASQKIQMT